MLDSIRAISKEEILVDTMRNSCRKIEVQKEFDKILGEISVDYDDPEFIVESTCNILSWCLVRIFLFFNSDGCRDSKDVSMMIFCHIFLSESKLQARVMKEFSLMDTHRCRVIVELVIPAINEFCDDKNLQVFQLFLLPMIDPNCLTESELCMINLSRVIENFDNFILLLEQVLDCNNGKNDFYSVMMLVEILVRSLYHVKSISGCMNRDDSTSLNIYSDKVFCLMINHCRRFYDDAFISLKESHYTFTERDRHNNKILFSTYQHDYPIILRGAFIYLHELYIKEQFSSEVAQFSDFFRFYLLTSGSFNYESPDQQKENNKIVYTSLCQLIKLVEMCITDKVDISIEEREELLIELVNYAETLVFRNYNEVIQDIVTKLLNISDQFGCEKLKKYIHMLFVRIIPPNYEFPEGFEFCHMKSMIISARSGDYYSRSLYMLHLMGLKLDFIKGFKKYDQVLLPDIAMKVLTYNAGLEFRSYQKNLSNELISRLFGGYFKNESRGGKEFMYAISALLMEVVYNYDRVKPTVELDENIKDVVGRTKNNALYRSIVAVAVYISRGADEAFKVINSCQRYCNQLVWVKGWILQDQGMFSDAIDVFKEIPRSEKFHLVNMATCLWSKYEEYECPTDEKHQCFGEIIGYCNSALEYYKGFPEHTIDHIAEINQIIDQVEKASSNVKPYASSIVMNSLDNLFYDESDIDRDIVSSKKKKKKNKKKYHNTTSEGLHDVESKVCSGEDVLKLHEYDSVECLLPKQYQIANQDESNLWGYVKKNADRLINKYMIHMPDVRFWNKPSIVASGSLKTSKRVVISSGKNHYSYFSPLVQSTMRKIDQYEKDGDFEKIINIIFNILLSKNNGFLIGQNIIFDRLGWLLFNNSDMLLPYQSKKSRLILQRYSTCMFLISIANNLSMDISHSVSNRMIESYDVMAIVERVRECLSEIEGQDLDGHNLCHQFKVRICCRLTNIYHALRFSGEGRNIGKPLMELRGELLPEQKKYAKELRKQELMMSPFESKVRVVSTLINYPS